MQQLAMSWLVYRMTGSAWLLGVVSFLNMLPAFLFSPIAGVLADRHDKRKMLIAAQTAAMLQAFTLAALVLGGWVQIWHIVFLGMILGFVNAFDMPIRQSFIVEMLGGKEDLNNAIALNSSIVNGARMVGPALAGLAVAAVGEGFCFLLNAVSFIAVIIALYKMDIPRRRAAPGRGSVLPEIMAGFQYLLATPPLAHILLLMGTVSLFGMAYQVLMPVYVEQVLKGGPETLGIVMGAAGAGALCAAVALAARKSPGKLLPAIPVAAAAFGGTLILLSLVKSLPLAVCVIALLGFAMMTQIAASNTMLQSISADDMRGRVMAYYTMAFLGLAPFGGLYSGSVAQWIGVRAAFAISGAACMAGALIFRLTAPRKLLE